MESRPPVTFSSSIENAEIMLRMLRVIFRGDVIPGRLSVAGKRQVPVKQMTRISPNPHLRPIAAEGLVC